MMYKGKCRVLWKPAVVRSFLLHESRVPMLKIFLLILERRRGEIHTHTEADRHGQTSTYYSTYFCIH